MVEIKLQFFHRLFVACIMKGKGNKFDGVGGWGIIVSAILIPFGVSYSGFQVLFLLFSSQSDPCGSASIWM